jgi:hypothetical protein
MRAAPVGHVGPDEIAETFEAPEELIHGLLAHPGALGEQAGANPIRTRKLQYRHVRHAEFLEPGRAASLSPESESRAARTASMRASVSFTPASARSARICSRAIEIASSDSF